MAGGLSNQALHIDPKVFEGVVGEALDRGIRGGLSRAGLRIEKSARLGAPEDSGSLGSSITSQPGGSERSRNVTVGPNAQSTDGAPYDIFQEFGTGVYAEGIHQGWGNVEIEGDVVGSKYSGRDVVRPRKAKALAFNTRGKPGKGESAFRRLSNIRTKTTKTTKFWGEGIVVRWVRGVRPTRYMRNAINGLDFEGEFVKGFDATK